ncbi:Pyridoxine/pyridoxamine 5'-phosphate oxidase [Paraconexibacter sp. AEG42_29]|uniref:Pyridoxine/pyridoxamine 5'-phosphate oxidase n=2 Tax=Paraconexibacter sp. AEG42_29 TaxID=2997339 RepID=A0AAU7AW44_9ACTN
MRRTYERGGLDEADLAGGWLPQLERWLADAVAAGVTEPNAMVLATADAAGAPSARTVLLKGLDDRGLVLYTNLGSRKGREVAANPAVSLVFPWVDLQRQVVVCGTAVPVDAAESDAYFASRPHGSQLGAAVSPQSTVIAARDVLTAARAELERAHPAGTPVPRPDHWGGLRVRPSSVEFWQGRPDRLHDRLRFRADGGAWVVERLAP